FLQLFPGCAAIVLAGDALEYSALIQYADDFRHFGTQTDTAVFRQDSIPKGPIQIPDDAFNGFDEFAHGRAAGRHNEIGAAKDELRAGLGCGHEANQEGSRFDYRAES